MRASFRSSIGALATAVLLVFFLSLASPRGQTGDTASIAIDAAKVANRLSPRLYGQFAEFMFENMLVRSSSSRCLQGPSSSRGCIRARRSARKL